MYSLKRIWVDREGPQREQWLDLMKRSNLSTDLTSDYVIGVYNEATNALVATGGYSHNIIQGVAICKDAQSNNLLNTVTTHLMQEIKSTGQSKTYVYTKPKNVKYFKSMGFKELVQTDSIAFMEAGLPSFESYLQKISQHHVRGNNSAIVMNANPFTKGHQFLVSYASQHSDHVYVFVLTEDRSFFSAQDRLAMVKLGTAHLDNVTVIPTDDYMVSQTTFPTYFLKDKGILEEDKVRFQAEIDAKLFKERIANALDIKTRFVGEEPYSPLTDIYNEVMKSTFSDELALKVIPRHDVDGDIISATKVRNALEEGDEDLAFKYLPQTTIDYIKEHKIIK